MGLVSKQKTVWISMPGRNGLTRSGREPLGVCFKPFCHTLVIGKYQICKLTARHSVARCELVGLIFFKNRENVPQIFERMPQIFGSLVPGTTYFQMGLAGNNM